MSARIARGSQAAYKRPRAKAGRTATRRKSQPGLLEQSGLTPQMVRAAGLWLLLVLLAAAAVAAIAAFRVPQLAGLYLGERIGDAGFAVKRVEITGLERMQRLPVYSVALDQPSMAMPLVDLADTRRRLLGFGWIEEARVSRRLPDTLVIDVVERVPAAIWQHERRLSLIDRHGVVLEPVRLDAMPDLPLMIGPAANLQAEGFQRLIDATPELRPIMAGATWVGGRRWDLRFQSGEVLALPEGEEEAVRALVNFARMDQQTQLLGRGLVRFDMRIPGKFIVRVSDEPGGTVPLLEPDPSAGAPANLATTI